MNKRVAIEVLSYLYKLFLREEFIKLVTKTDNKLDDKLVDLFDAVFDYTPPANKEDKK